jgi:uncharacterized Zn finger protein
MDTGAGRFKPVVSMEQWGELQGMHPNHGGTFRVGEELEIKGSRFRVKKIKPKELVLKLLPKDPGN